MSKHENSPSVSNIASNERVTKMFSWNDTNPVSHTTEKQDMATDNQKSSFFNKKANAVCVKRAFKYYGSKNHRNHVLINLNMLVPRGSIYGLLGASGCGKTTLLSCIVGRRKLNSGDIWVLGGKPGTKESGIPGKKIGYMPQEIALYGEFTIQETIMYFGWIFGMGSKEIKERLQFLLNFLDLPTKKRIIKKLSGGEQRRTSFAIALMHDPELLILDEPTVGVDPLLRQSIWNHLAQITKNGNKTVIITTHYIEEAKQAHTIGIMRNGKLLAEDAPSLLLQVYRCTSLENVFLKLACIDMEQNNKNQSSEICIKIIDSTTVLPSSPFNLDNKSSYPYSHRKYCGDCLDNGIIYKLCALVWKNFLRMWRNLGVMMFIFLLPVIQVILFCLVIGGNPHNLHIAIVNLEVPYFNNTYQECNYSNGCIVGNFSCRYLENLGPPIYVKKYFKVLETAKDALRNGDTWGLLHFRKDFTNALVNRVVLGEHADEKSLHDGEIQIWLDMSNYHIGITLQKDLQLAYQKFLKKFLKQCRKNEDLAEIPLSFEKPVYGSKRTTFTNFVAPGVILTMVFFLALALTTSSLIIERIEGLLDRSLVAGITTTQILFSHVITQFFVMCAQTVLILIFMILIFKIECKGNIFLIIVLVILQGLCGMSFGFVISASCSLERNALQFALGSFYPTLLLSGIIWPIEGMPTVLKYISKLLPLTLATASLRSIMSRNWNITHPTVYYGFMATGVWILIFLTISMIIVKLKRE